MAAGVAGRAPWPPPVGDPEWGLASPILLVPVWIVEDAITISPLMPMGPTGTHNAIDGSGATVIIARHLGGVFSDGPGHADILDLAACVVIQYIVCASRGDHAFENTAHANRIVIVTCKGRRRSGCKDER